MTAQAPERLIYANKYDNKMLPLCTEPLAAYFQLVGMVTPFAVENTGLWRGYIGTWEIRDDRLYLLRLDGRLKTGKAGAIADIFPGFADRVFGHWFSGRLRSPEGKLLEYVHGGYRSIYERELIIEIEQGVVTASRINSNGNSADNNAPDGYHLAATTTLG